MSMTMQISVLRPEEYRLSSEGPRDEKGYEPFRGYAIVWEPHALIELHSAKPNDEGRYPFGVWRAEYCALSFLYGKLLNVPDTWNRSMFVPPFAMPEDTNKESIHRGPEAWFSERRLTLPENSPITFPWYRPLRGISPNKEDRQEHNALVSLSKREFRKWRKRHAKYRPGPHQPGIVWHSCTKVASWFRELEKSPDHHGTVLREDPEALTIVESWRGSLAPLGRMKYRAMFTFDYNADMRSPFF